MRALFFAFTVCLLVAGCMGAPPVPINAPDPYSDALADYLNQPRLTRVGVLRWLGPPAATRMDGKYELYFAFREKERDLVTGTPYGAAYFLLVEYDDRGQLVRHDKIVNEGCTDEMLCIRSWAWAGAGATSSLDEITNSIIRHLVLYATPDMDQQAKDSLMSREGCRDFIYLSNENDSPNPEPKVTLVDSASGGTFWLPADGYMVFAGECGARQISVAWADWSGDFEEQALHLGGVVPGTIVTRLDPKLVKHIGWKYSITTVDVSPEEAAQDIQSRRLVLR